MAEWAPCEEDEEKEKMGLQASQTVQTSVWKEVLQDSWNTTHVDFIVATAGRDATCGVVFPSKSEQLNFKCSSTRLLVKGTYFMTATLRK